jgi:stage III sporulation protein AF
MNGLAEWLRHIVAVVLLAALVDLLLPNRTMQRYVRFVAGLIVLLTIASPLLQWIKGDFGTQLAAGLVRGGFTAQEVSADAELRKIEEAGGQLRQRQNEQAARLVASRMSEEIREAVEQSERRPVDRVEVETDDGGGAPAVAKVTVVLAAPAAGGRADGKDDGPKPIADVEPVAPVAIDVTAEMSAEGGERPAMSAPSPPDETEADGSTRQRIAALIESRFGVPQTSVKVLQAAGAAN